MLMTHREKFRAHNSTSRNQDENQITFGLTTSRENLGAALATFCPLVGSNRLVVPGYLPV